MMNRMVFAVVAILAVTSMALAQGGGGGGRGQGGGGRMGMMRGGDNSLQLLGRSDVKKDLKLTDEQNSKIAAFQEEQNNAMRQRMEDMRNSGERPDQETMRKMMEEISKKQAEAIAKILTPEQQARLKQIRIQLGGNRVLMDPEVQKALGITADQKSKLDALQAKQNEANQSIMEKMRNEEISREEAQAAREKNNQVMDAEMGKILTEAQKLKLKEMAGPKFEAEPQERRGP